MAMITISWDLPPADQMEAYLEWSRQSIKTVLDQPGLKEIRVYRNPFRITPEILTCREFDSLSSCIKFIQSEAYATNAAKMKALGCKNFSVQLWDVSPFAPEPLKPPGS